MRYFDAVAMDSIENYLDKSIIYSTFALESYKQCEEKACSAYNRKVYNAIFVCER